MLNVLLRYKYIGDSWIFADLLSDYGFDIPYEIDY